MAISTINLKFMLIAIFSSFFVHKTLGSLGIINLNSLVVDFLSYVIILFVIYAALDFRNVKKMLIKSN